MINLKCNILHEFYKKNKNKNTKKKPKVPSFYDITIKYVQIKLGICDFQIIAETGFVCVRNDLSYYVFRSLF